MRKPTKFKPYTEIEVVEIYEGGAVLCNLYGESCSDTNIYIEPDSPYYPELTEEERATLDTDYEQIK